MFDLGSRVVAFDLMVRWVNNGVRGFSIGCGLVAHSARRNDAARAQSTSLRARSDVDETMTAGKEISTK